MADPERFDMDPDPTFHADADPDPTLFSLKEQTNSSKSSPILSKIVPNCNFLSNNAGGGVRGEG